MSFVKKWFSGKKREEKGDLEKEAETKKRIQNNAVLEQACAELIKTKDFTNHPHLKVQSDDDDYLSYYTKLSKLPDKILTPGQEEYENDVKALGRNPQHFLRSGYDKALLKQRSADSESIKKKVKIDIKEGNAWKCGSCRSLVRKVGGVLPEKCPWCGAPKPQKAGKRKTKRKRRKKKRKTRRKRSRVKTRKKRRKTKRRR